VDASWDLNGDGRGDVLVVGGNRLYVYWGAQAGLSQTPTVLAPPTVGGNAAAYFFGGAASGVATAPETLSSQSTLDTYFGAAGVD
jgi:FG-GAP-like repeat